MKWLLTKTLGGDRMNNYVRWLQGKGIHIEPIGSFAERPHDLTPYSALLLTGGCDINPDRYGQSHHGETKPINDDRDELELALIGNFLTERKPVFGVCRGIQILNVALGGALIQHIPDELGAREVHRDKKGADVNHGLVYAGTSALASAIPEIHLVNSAHHQAVQPKALGRGLRVAAVSPAGIIEALEGDGLPAPVFAVQWHPERLDAADPASGRLLEFMISLVPRRS